MGLNKSNPILLFQIAKSNNTILIDNSMLAHLLNFDQEKPIGDYHLSKKIDLLYQYYSKLYFFIRNNSHVGITSYVYRQEFLRQTSRLENKIQDLVTLFKDNSDIVKKLHKIDIYCGILRLTLADRILNRVKVKDITSFHEQANKKREKISYADIEIYLTAVMDNAGIITKDMDFFSISDFYGKTQKLNSSHRNYLPNIYIPVNFESLHTHRYLMKN